ncbi:MAG: phosphoglycerate kinase [Deltaproteobacteria bacterium]|nr:phosphoglycerate kinase [Deltaproteobacteria bacterium]MBW2018560.1 phosphoglycerate kinase [Deltaproteobacteria bacterium]MBW2073295.1 phosphoglycerate kinase [Deltaproteobacteria bacterium]RLB83347.1 MAG: phosphoglycerate kinase [Deltaproteobacteria bacterium]
MKIRSIDEVDLKGKQVLIRVDFNVPLDEQGNIADDTRIRSVLSTLNHALDEGAKVIIASHLGRPKGQRVEKYSLAPCARRLSRLLSKEVRLAPDCVGPEVEEMVQKMKPGDVLLLENLRFHKAETDNDAEFARALARLADVYINDGFAVAHRVNASVVAVTSFVKECCAGFLMKKELQAFSQVLENPGRPLVAILGGGKVADKVGAVSHLVDKADKVILGGAIAYTFLRAQGIDTGTSLVEGGLIPQAQQILQKAREKRVKLYLPVDCVVAQEKSPKAQTLLRPIQEIPDGWMALDIGPASVTLFSEVLENARTIVWNGPMGVYEMDPFSRGTFGLLRKVASSYAFTVLGGGDLDVAVHRTGEAYNISYISTGGGAFVALLEGNTLPAIKALMACEKGEA